MLIQDTTTTIKCPREGCGLSVTVPAGVSYSVCACSEIIVTGEKK